MRDDSSRRRDRSRRAASLSGVEPSLEGHRHLRIERLLHEELSSILRDELSDPRLDGVVFTHVTLSSDYSSAKVRFALRPDAAQRTGFSGAERALEHASGFLRARVAEALDLKRTPSLHFSPDRDTILEPEGGERRG